DARAIGQARDSQPFDDGRKQRWRNGEVEGRSLGAAQCGLERLVGPRVVVVAADVAQEREKMLECRPVIDSSRSFYAVRRALAQLRQTPSRGRDADQGNVKGTPLRHRIERWEDLLVSEVSGYPEQHQGIGGYGVAGGLFHYCFLPFFSSSCPPNCLRIADRTRLAKSASPREPKRS